MDPSPPRDEASIDSRIAQLSEYLSATPQSHGEEIRELYSEILDLCGDEPEPEHAAVLESIGDRIAALEKQGVLPRAFIRRSRSRL